MERREIKQQNRVASRNTCPQEAQVKRDKLNEHEQEFAKAAAAAYKPKEEGTAAANVRNHTGHFPNAGELLRNKGFAMAPSAKRRRTHSRWYMFSGTLDGSSRRSTGDKEWRQRGSETLQRYSDLTSSGKGQPLQCKWEYRRRTQGQVSRYSEQLFQKELKGQREASGWVTGSGIGPRRVPE